MPHQDQHCHSPCLPGDQALGMHWQSLRWALDWLLAGVSVGDLKLRKDCTWSPLGLIRTALLWVWSDEKTLVERFQRARKIYLWGWQPAFAPAGSYQAFTKLLSKWTEPLVLALVGVLRKHMQEEVRLREHFCVSGLVVMAVDGSRLALARTLSLEAAFAPAAPSQRSQRHWKRTARRSKRKGKRTKSARAQDRSLVPKTHEKKVYTPQMWLTVMWHVGLGLPWDWRTGPSGSSERQHLLEMIDALPPGALVTADAGFIGYEYWSRLLQSGRQFLIRVGSNVTLLKKLGYVRLGKDIVFLWPEKAAVKNLPPLTLRLVVVHTQKQPMFLVTSILQKATLSDTQLVQIYSTRWGVELFYRHFKQTYECRKLRSHKAGNARLEADWSLVGLWAMALYALAVLLPEGIQPKRLSVAGILRAFRRPMREYKSRPDPGESLKELLTIALIDPYQRKSKASRNYPQKRRPRTIGAPLLIDATLEQKQKAQRFKHHFQEGLTA